MFQLTLTINRENAVKISDVLEGAGATAVSLVDGADTPIYEPDPGEVALWNCIRVSSWFEHRAQALDALTGIKALLGPAATINPIIEAVEERDWELVGRECNQPLGFGGKLWVVPPEKRSAYEDLIHVVLTPGLAFGSGSHPTTALCLTWLCEACLTGKVVVDYGCGSGILGIAALKLGAEKVIAVDHDDQALTATRENAQRNRVDSRLMVLSPDCLGPVRADIVVANILLNPLIALAPRFAGMLKPRATVVLSGVMKNQLKSLRDGYAAWFALEVPRFDDEWVCVVGRPHP